MTAPKWFQKLRRRKANQQQQSPCTTHAAADAEATTSAASAGQQQWPTLAVSPNRASYYFASADRALRQDRDLPCAAAALDVRVDVVHRRSRRLGGLDAPPGTPELRLRRIATRPLADCSDSGGGGGSATTSAATTPSTRARGFRVKPTSARRRRRSERDGKKGKAVTAEEVSPSRSPRRHGGARSRRRLWLYDSLVVVKASSDPERELAESMADMVVANAIRSPDDLEELLACYLALNAAEHHRAVVAAFRRVWCLLARHSLLLL